MADDGSRRDRRAASPRPEGTSDYSLVATMVHDLKNPLAALAGNLAILREELAGHPVGDIANRCLGDSVVLCTRALLMLQAIADVEALEAGAIVARPVLTRLRPEVDAALGLAAANISAREQVLDIDVADDLTAIVDGRLLAHVIQNLLDNAVRYAPRQGHIRIAAAVAERRLTLEVGNDGPALTEEERARVFDPEFRSAERRAGARLGRDFGLHFCNLVAAAHQGTISVESRPGYSTVFVVRIPG